MRGRECRIDFARASRRPYALQVRPSLPPSSPQRHGGRGEGCFSSLAKMKAACYFGAPSVRALREATRFASLRKAGMPEE